jgi:hypothetical protein
MSYATHVAAMQLRAPGRTIPYDDDALASAAARISEANV